MKRLNAFAAAAAMAATLLAFSCSSAGAGSDSPTSPATTGIAAKLSISYAGASGPQTLIVTATSKTEGVMVGKSVTGIASYPAEFVLTDLPAAGEWYVEVISDVGDYRGDARITLVADATTPVAVELADSEEEICGTKLETSPTAVAGAATQAAAIASSALSSPVWNTSSLASADTERWYKLTVTPGSSYSLHCDDRNNGSFQYTADIVARLYDASGAPIPEANISLPEMAARTELNEDCDGNYGTGVVFTMPSTGNAAYLKVAPCMGNEVNAGTFAFALAPAAIAIIKK